MSDKGSAAGLSRREVIQRGGAAAALALTGGDLLAACGSAGSGDSASSALPSAGGPPVGGTPVRGGTLRLGFISGGQAETLIPRARMRPSTFFAPSNCLTASLS